MSHSLLKLIMHIWWPEVVLSIHRLYQHFWPINSALAIACPNRCLVKNEACPILHKPKDPLVLLVRLWTLLHLFSWPLAARTDIHTFSLTQYWSLTKTSWNNSCQIAGRSRMSCQNHEKQLNLLLKSAFSYFIPNPKPPEIPRTWLHLPPLRTMACHEIQKVKVLEAIEKGVEKLEAFINFRYTSYALHMGIRFQSLSWLMFWLRSVLIKASKFLRHCSVSIPRTKEMNNIFSKPSPSIDLISDLRLQLLELAIL